MMKFAEKEEVFVRNMGRQNNSKSSLNMKEPEKLTSINVHETAIKLLQGDNLDIIDLGAGEGALCNVLKKRNHIIGTDLHPEDFKCKDVKCIYFNVDKVTKTNKKYDAVFCINVIEHLYCSKNLIINCYNLLKPNGQLIFCMPNNENWYTRLSFLFIGKFPHYRNENKRIDWFVHRNPTFLYLFKELIQDYFIIEKVTGNKSFIPILRIPLPFKNPFFSENIIIRLRRK